MTQYYRLPPSADKSFCFSCELVIVLTVLFFQIWVLLVLSYASKNFIKLRSSLSSEAGCGTEQELWRLSLTHSP